MLVSSTALGDRVELAINDGTVSDTGIDAFDETVITDGVTAMCLVEPSGIGSVVEVGFETSVFGAAIAGKTSADDVIGGSAVIEVGDATVAPSTVIAFAEAVPVLNITDLPPRTFIWIVGLAAVVPVTVIPLVPKKNVLAGSGPVIGTPSCVNFTPTGVGPATAVVPPIRILTSPPSAPPVAILDPLPILIVPFELLF